MGYVFCVGTCLCCKKTFVFNPVNVPSLRVRDFGDLEPVCKECVDRANPIRVAGGLDPITYAADAYEFCDENEI